MGEQNGWATIAAMLGTSAAVLRTAAAPWINEPRTPPMTPEQFSARLAELNTIAEQLNNTNLVEQQIREAMAPTDIPMTLPTQGKIRLVSDSD
jgi:hypothetical protein